MFTILACLFILFALDGVFRGRTLYDDGWLPDQDPQDARPPRTRLRARLRSVVWGGLALLCLVIASQFEW